MQHVSATEAKQQLAAILDAAQREPVMIRRQKRDVAVVLSAEDYARLTRANLRAFNHFCDEIGARAEAKGLTEKKFEALLIPDHRAFH